MKKISNKEHIKIWPMMIWHLPIPVNGGVYFACPANRRIDFSRFQWQDTPQKAIDAAIRSIRGKK